MAFLQAVGNLRRKYCLRFFWFIFSGNDDSTGRQRTVTAGVFEDMHI